MSAGGPPYRAIFESFGLAVEVLTDDHELYTDLPEALSEWHSRDGILPSSTFQARSDGIVLRDEVALPGVHGNTTLRVLAKAMRHHLALHAPDHIFIHAGVVDVGGAAIVIPGRSHSGKSTLVAALLEEGAVFYSDEYAVVDRDGDIHPYPRPLSLRGGRSHPPPSVHDGPRRPLRCGVIVVTRYERDAVWTPSLATRAEGAIALLDNTVAARASYARALRAAKQVAAGAQVLTGVRGEAAPLARSLREMSRAKSYG